MAQRVFTKDLYGLAEGEVLERIYREEVLVRPTRRVDLGGRGGAARVSRTLLGWEVGTPGGRKSCPDEPTARYLRVFAHLGLAAVQLPYNPVETARLVPRLEAVMDRLAGEADRAAGGRPDRRRRLHLRLLRFAARRLSAVEGGGP